VPFSLKLLLVALLAIRAIAAPWTYRPANNNPTHRNRLVISVRRWPPQRLQRFSGTSKLLRLYRGKDKVVPEAELRLQETAARFAWSRSSAGTDVLVLCHPLARLDHRLLTGRLTTFLRC
jgi:hypothetical protein